MACSPPSPMLTQFEERGSADKTWLVFSGLVISGAVGKSFRLKAFWGRHPPGALLTCMGRTRSDHVPIAHVWTP